MRRWEGVTSNTRALRAELQELLGQFREAVVTPYLTAWRQHVYRLAIELLVDARDYAREVRFAGLALNYGDLLQRAAKLLREQPDVRRALQEKYRWLFVDEFQDTDPIQAEVLLLLSADEEALNKSQELGVRSKEKAVSEADWTRVRPRPGSLFVVGDPKQSIFRFRRADIEVYDRVRRIIEQSGGQTVPLEASFRAVPALCEWVNDVFGDVFPGAPTPEQPEFHRLEPTRDDHAPPAGVCVLLHDDSVERRDVAGEDCRADCGLHSDRGGCRPAPAGRLSGADAHQETVGALRRGARTVRGAGGGQWRRGVRRLRARSRARRVAPVAQRSRRRRSTRRRPARTVLRRE